MEFIFYERGNIIRRNLLHFSYAIGLIVLSICINNFLFISYNVDGLAFGILTPINEEGFRLISVALGSPLNWLFTTLFSIYEYFLYIKRINFVFGCVPYPLMMIRIACVCMHFISLLIQFYGWKMSKKLKKKRYFYISYLIAVLFHTLWNVKYSIMVYHYLDKIL